VLPLDHLQGHTKIAQEGHYEDSKAEERKASNSGRAVLFAGDERHEPATIQSVHYWATFLFDH